MIRKFVRAITFISWCGVSSCVDRLPDEPETSAMDEIIVDGFISNEPGPYEVKIFRSYGVYSNLRTSRPVFATEVSITDDHGHVEDLVGVEPGIYRTGSPDFVGVVGNSYTLRFTDAFGNIYESTPQKILPSGEIENVYYQFDEFKPLKGPTRFGFKIYFNSNAGDGNEGLFRWRYQGTYRVKTNPELRTRPSPNNSNIEIPDPPQCAFVWNFELNRSECECCVCWITESEHAPKVKKTNMISDGRFRDIEIGYVPITGWTFYDKFRVEVKQMSLTKEAYAFWDIIQNQIEGADDLFQPPGGQPTGNIRQINGDHRVRGVFTASGVSSKVFYITQSEARKFTMIPDVELKDDCRKLGWAVTKKPSFWED